MNSNIIEIVTILVQKMLHNEDVFSNEEEIIQSLVDMGYELKEIELAFELIFSSTEIIDMSDYFEDISYQPDSVRIFSPRERYMFSDESQRTLLLLLNKKLLTYEEFEDVIKKSFSLPPIEIGIRELWYLLKSTVTDQMVLSQIRNLLPKFEDTSGENNHHVIH